ncbi:hypothetical protein [Mucilaginibacter phyllosphaerae]|uniref:DUF8188 domain-containing protein n=1 Tax=Mucilaginibacter phyllosphaerae TaxID=1812349 RepID=A0A4Y8AIH2_9SPHI|nr:hypothetical protein [Mucilaginibacter phyllosphaerae]MBB3968099.1 hypothetical protein [Mucilaginibacter phyllosphaerae]TEW68878.1 hypothetical protein E2R65_01580 [Mucilaginibacter phyllosphaerae]GGH01258.1 hypothetical protein GCM10007352_02900 [Mucilaginibacter phyllosphaerae]
MSKQSPYFFGLGLFVAPFIIFVLLIIFAPGTPSQNSIKSYVRNSKEITLTIDKWIYLKGGMWAENLVKGDEAKFSHRLRYYLNFRKNRYKDFAVFYSAGYKKYFVIESYNNSMQNLLNYQKENALTCMVNKEELNNKNYGTIKHPVPILWITKGLGLSYPEYLKLYTINVTEYLRFYKGRQAFDKGACTVCAY